MALQNMNLGLYWTQMMINLTIRLMTGLGKLIARESKGLEWIYMSVEVVQGVSLCLHLCLKNQF
jgi:hypothetical protein